MFSDYEQVYAKKRTRRQIFLDEMEATIPWDDFHALIRPVYHQPSAKGGVRRHRKLDQRRHEN